MKKFLNPFIHAVRHGCVPWTNTVQSIIEILQSRLAMAALYDIHKTQILKRKRGGNDIQIRPAHLAEGQTICVIRTTFPHGVHFGQHLQPHVLQNRQIHHPAGLLYFRIVGGGDFFRKSLERIQFKIMTE